MRDEEVALEQLALMHHIEKVIDKRILDAIEKHEMDNSHTMTDIYSRLTQISDQLKDLDGLIRSGFPNGDPVTHRLVHETYIKEAESRSLMWRDVKTKIIGGALWAALVAIALASWASLKDNLHR